ncbi:Pyruvate/Phosphoenolpyruvate kinase-like domain-containing protein [Mycena alexandri]|uniref:Pyruvate/Phosphoenolpyruvate kinase-like domain-containing protein n=1 Tax=Mycena alexandri TaxID=1745969 RepID=A0AAD6SFL4_9AGAR|nr:Pyruvate/Phosphoenolpyruvate kinase-like domain-containing protein [Mycena alexandri]
MIMSPHCAHKTLASYKVVPAAERAPTRQQPNNLQALFKSGQIVISTSLSYPSRHVAKTVAVTGADMCWIDAEHAAWSPTDLVEFVHVPSKKAFDYMAWCLDAGAGGLILPHLETVEEMKDAIAACYFPPIGHRSFPPFSFIPGVTDTTPETESIFSLANKHITIIPQIESRVGIQNLDAIMKMEEISAFMIGAGDLRLDMGLSLGLRVTNLNLSQPWKKPPEYPRNAIFPFSVLQSGRRW